MPLSDVEIWAEIGAGRLVIDPTPDADRVVGSSIDLLLHDDIVGLPDESEVRGISIDPSEPDIEIMSVLSRFGKARKITNDAPFKLEPRMMVIGKTLEEIKIPLHLAARIEGKSSLARLGLAVHITAPTVQSGFEGRLFLEMYNAGPFTLELKPFMKIAQLIIEHLGLPAREGYGGRFLRQQ